MRQFKALFMIFIVLNLVFGSKNIALAETVKYGAELSNEPNREYEVIFNDVPQTHWAFAYIMEMNLYEVVSGYPDGKFRPDRTVSRAEFAKILSSFTGIKPEMVKKSSFIDIKPSDWYSPFVEAGKKYLTGYETIGGGYVFKPDKPILREDIAVAIVRAKGYDVKFADRSIAEAMFSDYESISEAAKDYVSIAVENKLISGYSDGSFKAQKPVSRGETCALLWRAFMYGDENKVIIEENHDQSIDNVGENPFEDSNTTSSNKENMKSKYIVETITGGNGYGHFDGKVNEAKIGNVWSMVVDNEDNIFLLDNLQEYSGAGWYTEDATGEVFFSNEKYYGEPVDYSNQKVRKIDNMNRTVSTILNPNNDLYSINSRNVEKSKISYSDFAGYKLFSNIEKDHIFLSGKFTKNSNSDEEQYVGSLFNISPTVREVVYDKAFNYMCGSIDYAFMLRDKSILYSRLYGSNFDTYRVKENGKPMEYSKNCNTIDTSGAPRLAAFLQNGKLFVMVVRPKGDKANLIEYNLSTGEWTNLAGYDGTYDAVMAMDEKFYVSKESSIYEIGSDGERKKFIDGKNLILSDNMPIGKIELFDFDSKGNIIFYDSTNYSIRRISL